MGQSVQVAQAAAIIPSGTSAVETSMAGQNPVIASTDGKSAVDDRGWFAEMAQDLLPEKPGTALWSFTGYDERLCQKYAAGTVKPSAYFLRVLIRSEQGEPFFRWLMSDCTAQWWIEFQKHERMGAAAERER